MGIGVSISKYMYEEELERALQTFASKQEIKELLNKYMKSQPGVHSKEEFLRRLSSKNSLIDSEFMQEALDSRDIFKTKCVMHVRSEDDFCEVQKNHNRFEVDEFLSSFYMAYDSAVEISLVEDGNRITQLQMIVPIEQGQYEVQLYDISRPLPYILVSTQRYHYTEEDMTILSIDFNIRKSDKIYEIQTEL